MKIEDFRRYDLKIDNLVIREIIVFSGEDQGEDGSADVLKTDLRDKI